MIIVVGVVVVLIGLLAWSGALSWFGRLPGDLRIERDNLKVHIPLVSMLLVSVVATILLSLFRR